MPVLMTVQAPVGAPQSKKLSVPMAISVAVMALGATGCGSTHSVPDGGTCASGCFLSALADGGSECICGV
jgi:hypothetical protein